MKRNIAIGAVLVISGMAFGQGADPRWQRARREQAVAYVGHNQVARSLVETYGEDAVSAIAACSPPIGKRLAEWHNSGEFERQIDRPRLLLKLIGQPGAGDQVAWFAMQNAQQLTDPDTLDAFLVSPFHYTCGIKKLADGALEIRGKRLEAEAAKALAVQPVIQGAPQQPAQVVARPETNQGIIVAIGLALLVAGIIWWKRRQAENAPA